MSTISADADAILRAADLLRAGALVAFPTETVYGLGADATNGRAVAAIFEAKGRPRFNPLIVHVAALEDAERLAVLTDSARALARAFWPGPLTMVLARRQPSPISDLVTAGLDTIAVRVPSHPVARALLVAAGCPVAAPSANRSGHVSATTAAHVATDLGAAVSLILDGGATPVGIESTVVDASGAQVALLRSGGIATEAIERVIAAPLVRATEAGAKPSSPGQLSSHYAPSRPLRLDAVAVRPGEALMAFGPDVPAHDGPCVNLSASGDLREAAANLFAAMRALDASGAAAIAVMTIPERGLGEAINDRLRRAAAPR